MPIQSKKRVQREVSVFSSAVLRVSDILEFADQLRAENVDSAVVVRDPAQADPNAALYGLSATWRVPGEES